MAEKKTGDQSADETAVGGTAPTTEEKAAAATRGDPNRGKNLTDEVRAALEREALGLPAPTSALVGGVPMSELEAQALGLDSDTYAFLVEQQREYTTYRAGQVIEYKGVRAFNPGDPVPVSQAERLHYVELGWVVPYDSAEARSLLAARVGQPVETLFPDAPEVTEKAGK